LSHALTLPSSEGESFVLKTVELLPEGSTAAAREEVTQVLRTLPVGEWLLYITQMRRLYCISVSSTREQLKVLEALRTIPVHELELYITQMMRLDGAERRYYSDQLKIIENLRMIPVHELEACIEQTKHLPPSLKHAALIIKLAAARIMVEAPTGEGGVLLDQLLALDPYLDLISIFGQMTDHTTRQSIFAQVLRICTPTTSREDRVKIVELLQEVPPADLQDFSDAVAQLSSQLTDGHRSHLIADLLRVLPDNRLAFVHFMIGNNVTEIEEITRLINNC
jgi:hypothetical protein